MSYIRADSPLRQVMASHQRGVEMEASENLTEGTYVSKYVLLLVFPHIFVSGKVCRRATNNT